MSVSTAIGAVSESLRNLLVGEMKLQPTVPVTILAPDEGGGDRRINLFLYQVQENPAFKNLDWQLKRGTDDTLVPPPLSLNLLYLMTPYAPNDQQTGNAAVHKILGEAMRVFHEYAIVPKNYLTDDLQDAHEHIQIAQNPLNMEELSRIWSTFTHPFRLSVLYQVSVVQLDASPASEQPMKRRVEKIGVSVSAPYDPPVVEKIDPLKGAPGTMITVHGQHLAGWQADVVLGDGTVLDNRRLTEAENDQFSVTLPATSQSGKPLEQGFHEVRVDIGQLCRKTFFLEVTP